MDPFWLNSPYGTLMLVTFALPPTDLIEASLLTNRLLLTGVFEESCESRDTDTDCCDGIVVVAVVTATPFPLLDGWIVEVVLEVTAFGCEPDNVKYMPLYDESWFAELMPCGTVVVARNGAVVVSGRESVGRVVAILVLSTNNVSTIIVKDKLRSARHPTGSRI